VPAGDLTPADPLVGVFVDDAVAALLAVGEYLRPLPVERLLLLQ
jgi:hypothetical protein